MSPKGACHILTSPPILLQNNVGTSSLITFRHIPTPPLVFIVTQSIPNALTIENRKFAPTISWGMLTTRLQLRSTKAGLHFPVGRIHRSLKKGGFGRRIGSGAAGESLSLSLERDISPATLYFSVSHSRNRISYKWNPRARQQGCAMFWEEKDYSSRLAIGHPKRYGVSIFFIRLRFFDVELACWTLGSMSFCGTSSSRREASYRV